MGTVRTCPVLEGYMPLICHPGVYFAKDGAVSTGAYAAGAQTCWRNSATRINNCVALAEIVNLPSKFVSTNPYFVVAQTEWIIW